MGTLPTTERFCTFLGLLLFFLYLRGNQRNQFTAEFPPTDGWTQKGETLICSYTAPLTCNFLHSRRLIARVFKIFMSLFFLSHQPSGKYINKFENASVPHFSSSTCSPWGQFLLVLKCLNSCSWLAQGDIRGLWQTEQKKDSQEYPSSQLL